MFKRWWKLILLILLLPWLLTGGFLVFERVRGKISLARYKRELAAKGEKLTPAEFLPKADPQAENAAQELWRAVDRLNKETAVATNAPPRMRLLPSGRAIVCFREDFWADDRATNRWDEVEAELGKSLETLKQIRALLQVPGLRTQMDYEAGPKALFTQLPKAKGLVFWFGTSCQLALQDGRKDDALEDLLAQIRITHSLAEDRVVISELVRIAIAAMARNGAWEVLQAEGWSEKDLARIQEAWEQQEFATAMTRALEGEVAFAKASYDLMRKSNKEAASILFWLEEYMPPAEEDRPAWERVVNALPFGEAIAKFLKHQVYCRLWRFAWLDQDEQHDTEFLEELLTESRQAAKSKLLPEIEPGTNSLLRQISERSLYDRLRFPNVDSGISLGKSMSKAMRAETERSMIICALALKRFQLRHGKLPETLDALTPEFLAAVPVDYMDGKSLKYKTKTDGGFVLYSVGEDRQDDGGSTALGPGNSNQRNLWDRKDFVWPAPATTEEVEEYRKTNR